MVVALVTTNNVSHTHFLRRHRWKLATDSTFVLC